ncbi:hypothetical protein [Streptomyces anandii]|uniref:hypothetical protein n=1 Tax=Streptomyces anandii TaxID=285454 RepID=UPI00167B5B89|nr:hypothetical protein [Streptomyces anandii]GGY10184.1 hypothetical protein GCM10010510_65260 [Streptomyces anandii JCM 4720]
MPDDDAPSVGGNRPAEGHGEIELARRLARELAEAELVSSVSRAAEVQWENLLARLADEFRVLWEQATGASRSAPAGAEESFADRPDTGTSGPDRGAPGRGGGAPGRGGDAPGRGGAARPLPMPAWPWQPSVSQPSARARLQQEIGRLSPAARMAFEDELLRLVTTNADLRAVFDKSPGTIPTVVNYAGKARERQLLREAASPAQSPHQEPARDDVTRAATEGVATERVATEGVATEGWSWEQFAHEVSGGPLPSSERSRALSPGDTGIAGRAFGTAGLSGSEGHGHSDTDPAPPAAGSRDRTQPPPATSPAAPRLLDEQGQELLAAQVAGSGPTARGIGNAAELGPSGPAAARPATHSGQTRAL